MYNIFMDIIGLFLGYAPYIVFGIILAIIFRSPSKTKSNTPNFNLPVYNLKRSICYCLINAAFMLFFGIVNKAGWDGTNYSFGTWGVYGLWLTVFLALPLLFFLISNLTRYLKTIKNTPHTNELLLLAILTITIFVIILCITFAFIF